MKRFRILAVILALLMLPLSLFVACDKDPVDTPDDGEQGQTETCPNDKHKFGKRENVSTRTCTTDGVVQRVCKDCGYVEKDITPMTGHTLSDFVSDHSASCTEDGTKSKRCAVCSYREVEADVGSALGHNFLYYTAAADGYSETASCLRCNNATNTRLLGLTIDFEGDKSHASYEKFSVFTATDASASEYKTEGNTTYLAISRKAATVIGGTEFGVVLTPRADILKGANVELCPSYVVEYSIRINKANTGDLILLSGEKRGVTETFVTYDAAAGTINSNEGVVYVMKASDYDTWLKIAVRLNDGKKMYEIYVNNALVTDSIEAAVPYVTQEGYYMGFDLENLKIATAPAQGVASKFDIDNIALYLADAPKGYTGATDKNYDVIAATNGDKFVVKVGTATCEHEYVDAEPTAATCTLSGYTKATCSKCGAETVKDFVDPIAHDYEEKGTVDATCTVAKYTNSKCKNCGAGSIAYDGNPLGHTVDTAGANYKVIAVTCETDGWTEGNCVRCGIEWTQDKIAALGHNLPEDPAAYTTIAPTCLDEGYSHGKCVRCAIELPKEMVVKALGHTCAKPEVVSPTCTTPGIDNCVCDRCGEKYTQNETAELGHTMVSKITQVEGVSKIISTCVRCPEKTEADVLSKVPTYQDMADYFAATGKKQISHTDNQLYYFDKDSVGYVRGSTTTQKSSGKFIGRFGSLTTKTDLGEGAVEGNRYAEWEYSPQNDTKNAGHHCYFDIDFAGGAGRTKAGENIVFEFSLRWTEGEEEFMPFNTQLIDRSGKYASGNQFTGAMVGVNANGDIWYAGEGGNHVFAQVSKTSWTRFQMVYHSNPGSAPTFDLYIDGVLIVADVSVWVGDTTKQVCTTLDQIRFQVGEQGAKVTRKLDFDELYCYYAEMPYYVQSVNYHNNTEFATLSAELNTVFTDETTGATTTYLAPGALGKYVTISPKANTLFTAVDFDGTWGMSIKKGADVANTPGIEEDVLVAHDSFISVNQLGHYKKVAYETDIKVAAGTGEFAIFEGVKGELKYEFLTYKDGKIYAGETVVVEDASNWVKVGVATNENNGRYDVYVNGKKVVEQANASEEYFAKGVYGTTKTLGYRIFEVTSTDAAATYDVSLKNAVLVGGIDAPPTLAE